MPHVLLPLSDPLQNQQRPVAELAEHIAYFAELPFSELFGSPRRLQLHLQLSEQSLPFGCLSKHLVVRVTLLRVRSQFLLEVVDDLA